MHVDAAYGGPAMLADDLRPLFAGIERADSIAFDPHKWLYTPHSGGCVLVRDLELMRRSFDLEYVSYIVKDEEHTDRGVDLGRHSPNFSRGFWSLKVWISLLAHGRDAYARRISHDAALARYLGALVERTRRLRADDPGGSVDRLLPLRAPGPAARQGPRDARSTSNDAERADHDRHPARRARLLFERRARRDRFCLRACIVNFRTEAEDVEALVEIAAETGARLDAELRPATLSAEALA